MDYFVDTEDFFVVLFFLTDDIGKCVNYVKEKNNPDYTLHIL